MLAFILLMESTTPCSLDEHRSVETVGELSASSIPFHSGIPCNETVDRPARLAFRLPVVERGGVLRKDLFLVLEQDFDAWSRHLWPYIDAIAERNLYFSRGTFKSPWQWFTGLMSLNELLTFSMSVRFYPRAARGCLSFFQHAFRGSTLSV